MTRKKSILEQEPTEFEEIDFVQEHKKIPVTLNLTPCEDAVSRQAVLEQTYNWSKDEFLRVTNPFDYLRKRINSLPSVIPKPKTGHWINVKVGKLFPSNDFKCSECGNILDFDGVNCGRGDANFCPNCGAKMESEEKE